MPEDVFCVRCRSAEGDLDAAGVCLACRGKDTVEEEATVHRSLPDPFERTATDHLDCDPTKSVNGETSVPLLQNLSFVNYELHEVIGRGAMGLVFRATQKWANRVVALKVMAGATEFDDRARHRFQGEAESLGRSRHQGIVQIYEVGEENGRPFFSMEFVPGGTLARTIRDEGRLDPRKAAGLIARIARAVEAAHGVGVIHRDLKPSNILLDAEGTPKVADFGLAILTDRDSRVTSSGALLGTPSYMSPEQAAGRKEDISARTDVYALGATLYELLTGQPPFKADTSVATAVKVLNDAVVPPRKLNPAVPPDLETVCLTCLAKDPKDRYPSAAALAADLDAWADDKPVTAKPKVPSRPRRSFTTLAAVGPIAVVAVGLIVWGGDPGSIAPSTPQKTDKLRKGQALVERANELAQGRPITLIPEKGLPPADPIWVWGEAKLAPSDIDGTCSFQTQLLSMVELLNDPGNDHFILRGEFRHDFQILPEGFIGFYLGFDGTATANHLFHRILVVKFSDWPSVGELDIPANRDKHRLQIRDTVVFRLQDQLPDERSFSAGHILYPLPTPSPSWRELEVEVDPTAITVRLKDAGKWQIAKVPVDDLRSNTPRHSREISNVLKTPVVVPPLAPRRPLGIIAERSTLSIRKVTLTPVRP